ncbi:TPA: hypothetical protein NKY06_004488 [Vibrio parahaemolyticus]|nr:hypothetical protein [Vibrio parahaemolyticus]HCH5065408.1 hypothetical protein [Vibrio parahaemolyticus]
MNDPESISENVVYGWYEYLNEIMGVLFFSAAIASLQFPHHSSEIATISLIFLFILGMSLASKREVKRHTQRLKRYKGDFLLVLVSWAKTPAFMLGLFALISVAVGFNTSHVEGLSLNNLLGFNL